VRVGKKLRKYVVDPVKGMFGRYIDRALTLATSADAGTLRGKGYKV